ncbi:MAG TPA: hypothetical protein VGJ80_13840 [Gemmatimonadales bacterium]|jgi:hypothetical protein
MKKVCRFVPIALAGAMGGAVGAVACGGDSSGPGPQAASVTGVAGDSQTAPTGATLAFPLSFIALGSNGQPVQGVHVTWSVIPSGSASFNPATTVTDVNGAAATNATLGSFVGGINIHAAVPGVSDVVYHATVLDPCTYLAPYTFGQTVSGSLSATDCNFGNSGFYYDFYPIDLPIGQQSIRVTMNSTVFDTWVDFWSADGPLFGFDDDVILLEVQNSQLDIILPGGTYIIGANSYNQFTTGAYSITTATRPAAMNGCRQVWVSRGVTVNDSLTAADCADSSATPHYYDVARIELTSGTVVTIAEHSAAMNPKLTLYRILDLVSYTRSQVAQNDDSAGGQQNAFIQYSVTNTGPYDIVIGSSAPGETGAYTFDVSASMTLSGRPSAPIAARRTKWVGDVLGLPRGSKH